MEGGFFLILLPLILVVTVPVIIPVIAAAIAAVVVLLDMSMLVISSYTRLFTGFRFSSTRFLVCTGVMLAPGLTNGTFLFLQGIVGDTPFSTFVGGGATLLSLWSYVIVVRNLAGGHSKNAWILFVYALAAFLLFLWLLVNPDSPFVQFLLFTFGAPWVLGSVFAGWQVMQINRRLGRGETLESMGLRTADSSVDEGEVRDDAHVQ